MLASFSSAIKPSCMLFTLILLQMVPHPEEVPVPLGPDLLTVRKSGVSRTHSLPNDSYMCRNGSAAERSLGHRGWGFPKAQSGTKLSPLRESQPCISYFEETLG